MSLVVIDSVTLQKQLNLEARVLCFADINDDSKKLIKVDEKLNSIKFEYIELLKEYLICWR